MKKMLVGTMCFLILTSVISCRKYVEVDTYGSRTLKYTVDYQYLMNNSSNFSNSYILPLVTSDNFGTSVESIPTTWSSEFQNAYIWAEQFYSATQSDGGWTNLYKHIYIANEVLAGVMDSENGSIDDKQSIAAEAKVHRAFAYLSLVNQYAPIYTPGQASTQQGLPLLTTTDLFQNLSRASLQHVYDQIISDLTSALDYLPNHPTWNYHPSKLAAYALLSRVYLITRDFEKSGQYADLALELTPGLNDLQSYKGKTSTFPVLTQDPEVLLSKTASGTFNAPVNPELVALYNANDLRLQMWLGYSTNLQGYQYVRPNFTYQGIYIGVRTPEIILNRAEVYARTGNVEKTVELLNKLRIARFETANYVALTTADIASDPLQYVIDERRREFVGTDIRWYDMRRLTLDAGYYKTVTRIYKGATYTLEANSPRFVYPIHENILELNPEIGQNPR
ncbi:RagB/SusD family nutrient uptake outer membrane protein [Sphingobacterium sp. LRF_L2]|uniref:RagB/SusD family nutrient uptake outer membrane protein n=1 Tax=Sphingobacterium sp. LRF_L2 TaxID=3369421 RepID=UPI003F5DCA92